MMTTAPISPEDHERAGELFDLARRLPAEQRPHAVRSAPGFSDTARREALSLLAHLPDAGFLSPSAATPGVIDQVLRDVAGEDPRRITGTRVGHFRVEALVGAGGMGAVYRANDERTGQAVALKLLRPHALDRAGAARLRREARVLARMHHPGIARVLDAGVVPAGDHPDSPGTPFVAMELLEGALPITLWAKASHADTRDILAIMARVAEAVHHGHQRGVIHRDLKPQNILVLPDGSPKLIDFGIAFATDVDISRLTVSTSVGALVGTFAYMSPEQCEGDSAAIDIRSDVYALGVILFELLAGTRPHDLAARPLAEVLGAIRSGKTHRLERLRPDLAGDVATIVHKAMDPTPDARYASAADLAQDLDRFLTHRPIEARPAGVLDHLRLLWRRQRLATSTVALAAICIVSSGVVALFFGVQARAGQREAESALTLEAQARRRAERMTTFLRGAIGSANPYQPRDVSPALLASNADPWAEWMFSPWNFSGVDGNKATVENILTAAAGRLPGEFADDPIARADLAETLGVTLFRLEEFPIARTLLEGSVQARLGALGEDHEDTIRAMLRAAAVCDVLDGKAARVWWARAHDRCVQRFGPTDPRTLRAHRMLSHARHMTGENPAPDLFNVVPAPKPDDPPLPPAQLLHVASAAFHAAHWGDQSTRAVASEVLARLRRGDSDSDHLARVLTQRLALSTLIDTGDAPSAHRDEVDQLQARAEAVFGAWTPEFINTLNGVMYPDIRGRSSPRSAVYFAHAARAQARLRGPRHWETGNAIRPARDALGFMPPDVPGAREAATEVIHLLDEFPQGVTSPSAIATGLLARIEINDGAADVGLARIDEMLARMRAPQAPSLAMHAWASILTARAECLIALGRKAEAREALQEALATEPRFIPQADASLWLQHPRGLLRMAQE